MKTAFRKSALLIPAFLAVAAVAATEASQPSAGPKDKLRVLAGPEPRERQAFAARESDRHVEKETVPFLGVETSPVSPALSSQLNLARGSGLVVSHVVAKSPADGTLKLHDILLKLDDQILIETRQLSVLIRGRKEGDEVTLTYLRGGQQATAKVKLGKHEVPKFTAAGAGVPRVFALGSGEARNFEIFAPAPVAEGEREHVDRVLSLIERAPEGPLPRVRIDRRAGSGFRATSINTRNSNLVFSDDDGSLDLTIKDGVKSLVAKGAKGDVLFSGPVTTPEERKAMPGPVRERLEKLEGMHHVSFHTDGDFQGAEVKVMRPVGRGISLPPPPPAPVRPQQTF